MCFLGYSHAAHIGWEFRIKHKNGGWVQLSEFFANLAIGDEKTIEAAFYHAKLPLKITCLQLAKEQLFIVSTVAIGKETLLAYKQRWSIERSFKSLKTSGFNIEDTHIIDLRKLEKLFAICSIALTICVIAREIKNNSLPIKIRNHGCKLYSLFTLLL